jgi:hypothetical protein
MRSINTNSISGPAAVMTAMLSWWTSQAGLPARISAWLEGQEPTVFLNRTDQKVGERVMQELLLEHEFWAAVDSADPLRFMSEMCRVHQLGYQRTYVQTELHGEVGRIVKESGWFEKNRREINREKERLKAVRQVMES